MGSIGEWILQTERLSVRTATPADADFYHALWTDPRVMRYVGFPQGLPVAREELVARLSAQTDDVFGQLAVVQLKGEHGVVIGECMLRRPDAQGVAGPDLKLRPAYWGQGYGREVWQALVDYHFVHTGCDAIETSPHVENARAIRLYESVGASRVGEELYEFPEAMRAYTAPVPCYIYRLTRAVWESSRDGSD
ncbi:MAG: GNAT family N-acetyltransferase [Anaerolineae bacterium]|nr:GNAT family N-acetyltransferase [Anaerolineae bacterium]